MLVPDYFLIDFIFFIVVLLTNLLMIGVMICRIKNWEKAQEIIGIFVILHGIPAGYVLISNIIAGRYWWTIVIPLIFIAFVILDLLLEYIEIVDYDFRENKKILIPFLILYYAAFISMLPYIFYTIDSFYSTLILSIYILQFIISILGMEEQRTIEVTEEYEY